MTVKFCKQAKIHYHLSALEYIVLFRSTRQFISWLISVCGISLLFFSVVRLFGVDDFPISVALTGIIFGTIPSLIFALPVSLRVQGANTQTRMLINERIQFFGYEIEEANIDQSTFHLRTHPWLMDKENRIVVLRNAEDILVKGPSLILTLLRRRLVRGLT